MRRRGVALGAAALLLLAGAAPVAGERRLPADRGQPVIYVALGDSTVAGVGALHPGANYVSRLFERLAAVYPRAAVVNLGVSGATAADVLEEQLPRALGLRPDLVTLSIGPNDITRGRSPAEYERDLAQILRALARRTRAVVVVNLIPDLTVTPRFRDKEAAPEVGRRVRLFNEALGRQARAVGARVVDLYARSQEEVPRRPALLSADGYHPSDEGYARWAELMWDALPR
jgi:acyl-CoA thioesterase-1